MEENKPIERNDIEKGFEVAKGEYVVVDDEELKKIAPSTDATMENAKPYALFVAALTETKQDAIAKIAMHNREHVLLIRPSNGGLPLHTLYLS